MCGTFDWCGRPGRGFVAGALLDSLAPARATVSQVRRDQLHMDAGTVPRVVDVTGDDASLEPEPPLSTASAAGVTDETAAERVQWRQRVGGEGMRSGGARRKSRKAKAKMRSPSLRDDSVDNGDDNDDDDAFEEDAELDRITAPAVRVAPDDNRCGVGVRGCLYCM